MDSTAPLRIAITGPESTGKSALAQQLAQHYDALWVPEYSREYLLQKAGAYEFDDILQIARGQYEREEALCRKAGRFIFCDTDFLVTYIWEKVKYGVAHPWIEEMLLRRHYNFTLLCNTDLPWEFDPLRENPHNRRYLFNLYHQQLIRLQVPYAIVEGTGVERLNNAINAIEKFAGDCGSSPQ